MTSRAVNTKNTSYDELRKLALSCGFVVFQGKKHYKVKTNEDKFVTIIPRSTRTKRGTVLGIVKALIDRGADIEYN